MQMIKHLSLLFMLILVGCTKKSVTTVTHEPAIQEGTQQSAPLSASDETDFALKTFIYKSKDASWLKTIEAGQMVTDWSALALASVKSSSKDRGHFDSFYDYFLKDCESSLDECNYQRLALLRNNPYVSSLLAYLATQAKPDLAQTYFKLAMDTLNGAEHPYFVETYFYMLQREIKSGKDESFYLKQCSKMMLSLENSSQHLKNLISDVDFATRESELLERHCGAEWTEQFINKKFQDGDLLGKGLVIPNESLLRKADRILELGLDWELLMDPTVKVLDLYFNKEISRSILIGYLKHQDRSHIAKKIEGYSRLRFFQKTFETLTGVNGLLQSELYDDPKNVLERLHQSMTEVSASVWSEFFVFQDDVSMIINELKEEGMTNSELQQVIADAKSYKSLVKHYAVYPATFIALHYFSNIRYELVLRTPGRIYRFNPQNLFSLMLEEKLLPLFSFGNDMKALKETEALASLIFTLKAMPLLVEAKKMKSLVDSTLGFYLRRVFDKDYSLQPFIEKAIDQTTFQGDRYGPGFGRDDFETIKEVCHIEQLDAQQANYVRRSERDFYIPDLYLFTHHGINADDQRPRPSLSRMINQILANPSSLVTGRFHQFAEYFRTTVKHRTGLVNEVMDMTSQILKEFGVEQEAIDHIFSDIERDLKLIEGYRKAFQDSFKEKKQIQMNCSYDIMKNEWDRQETLIRYEMEYLKDVHEFMSLLQKVPKGELNATPSELNARYPDVDLSRFKAGQSVLEQIQGLLVYQVEQVPDLKPNVKINKDVFEYSNWDLIARQIHFIKYGYKDLPALEPNIRFFFNGDFKETAIFDQFRVVQIRHQSIKDFLKSSLRSSFHRKTGMMAWFSDKSNHLDFEEKVIFKDLVAAFKLSEAYGDNLLTAEDVVETYIRLWQTLHIDKESEEILQLTGHGAHYDHSLWTLTRDKLGYSGADTFKALLEYAVEDLDDSYVAEAETKETTIEMGYYRPLDGALEFYQDLQYIPNVASQLKTDIGRVSNVHRNIVQNSLMSTLKLIEAVDRYQGPLEFRYNLDEPMTPKHSKYPETIKNDFMNRWAIFNSSTQNYFETQDLTVQESR